MIFRTPGVPDPAEPAAAALVGRLFAGFSSVEAPCGPCPRREEKPALSRTDGIGFVSEIGLRGMVYF